MIPVLLIGFNLLREQRWPLLILLVWLVGSAFASGLGSIRPAPEDVLFFVRAQAVYGLTFLSFLAASAVHNERKSRRILAVLSKGIHRGQYLAGMLSGVMIAGVGYGVSMGAVAVPMFQRAGLELNILWSALVLLITAIGLTGTLAILFSTMLDPLLATAATAVTVAAAAGFAMATGTTAFLPVYGLVESILQIPLPGQGWHAPWVLVWWGLFQAVLLWGVATMIFSRRDIAVAIE